MATSSRRTYDTDSIVLRRIFVKNPTTNQQFSTNALLATSTNGSAIFVDAVSFFNSLGFPTSDAFPSTVAGLGTAGYISTPGGGSGDVTKANLISTVGGLGTIGYLSSPSLLSTIQGLGTLNYISLATLTTALASTVGGINLGTGITVANQQSSLTGLGTLGYISTATLDTALASTVAGLGTGSGDVTRFNLASTVAGLGTANYISTASLVSTVEGLGSLTYLSLATLNSTLASTVAGLGTGSGDVTKANLISSIEGLATSGYISSSQLFSSIRGISVLNSISTVSSLIISSPTAQININMAGATVGTYILNSISVGVANSDVTSTTQGLGTLDYISVATLNLALTSTVGGINLGTGITVANQQSSLTGLGTLGYTSVATLNLALTSTVAGIGPGGGISQSALTSSLQGLGSLSYVSVPTLDSTLLSTTQGLGTLGYISAAQLISTTLGLQTFVSTSVSIAIQAIPFVYAGATLYLNYSVTAGTYKALENRLLNTPQATLATTVNGGTSNNFIVGFQSDFGLPEKIPGGIWRIVLFCLASGANVQTYVSLFLRDSSGNETLVTSNSGAPQVVPLVLTELIISLPVPATAIPSGSVIVLKVFANNTAPSPNRTFTLYFEDSTYSYVQTTFGLLVDSSVAQSSLAGLGSAGYVSSLSLTSSLRGLGTLGYISSSQLTSTIAGLGSLNYISLATLNTALTSTVAGIGTGTGTSLTADQIISTVATTGYLSTIPSTILVENLALYQSTLGNPVSFITISSQQGGEISITANLIGLNKTYLTTSSFMEFVDTAGASPSTNLIGNASGKLTLGFRPITNPPELGVQFYNIESDTYGMPYDTVFNQIPFSNISSMTISTSFLSVGQGFALNGQNLFLSTNTSTSKQNLYVNELAVGSYNPVRVIYSTLGACNDVYLEPQDIGKYFLFDAASSGAGIYLPNLPDPFMDGWNIVIKNMATSVYNLDVQTTTVTTLSPGLATTVVMDGTNSYSL